MTDNLTDDLAWLPKLIELSQFGGDWQAFIDSAYDYYARDFIRDEPTLLGRTVKSKRHVAYNGQDHSFWHCIEEHAGGSRNEENRIPKISLVERIRWPRPIIEHVARTPGILAWTEIHHGHGTSKRAHLFVEDEDYCVVLEPRGKDQYGKPRYYFLWTTFLCETDDQHNKMLRRYARGEKIN